MTTRTPLEPVIVTDLFPDIRLELQRVLESLTDEQWEYPTVCTGWNVRDVALHLLGTRVGLLTNLHDHYDQHLNIDDWQEMPNFMNVKIEIWVLEARRIGRPLLMRWLARANQQIITFLNTLNPLDIDRVINWTDSQSEPIWMHIAREMTEQWIHHQYICEAVDILSLKEARFVHPVLSTFVYALPQTYQHTDAPLDTLVKLIITGEGGGTWHLVRQNNGWKLHADTDLSPTSTLSMDADIAWRLFAKRLKTGMIRQSVAVEGDKMFFEVLLN